MRRCSRITQKAGSIMSLIFARRLPPRKGGSEQQLRIFHATSGSDGAFGRVVRVKPRNNSSWDFVYTRRIDLRSQLNSGRKKIKKMVNGTISWCVERVWLPKWNYLPTSNRGIRSGEAHWRGERFVGDFTSARMLSVAPEDNRAYTSVEDTGKITCFRLSSLRKAAISDSLR